jgi:CRISPR-associated endonuclease/helicase Cas3
LIIDVALCVVRELFLISTSAGEVGFDLNADHLVGDAAPLDSWIQRLGRVNRRGKGIAIVQVFVTSPTKNQAKQSDVNKHTVASASANAIEALKQLPHAEPLDADERPDPVLDASPRALRNLSKPDNALSPPPAMVELTDILLDVWSMTSINQPMPGRPEVGPWLRGIADDLPQTTIAWRAELDEPGFADLELDDIEEWFDAHRILRHETLSVPTSEAVNHLVERWYTLDADIREKVAQRACVIDRAGRRTLKVEDLIKELSRKPKGDADSIRNADLILPASFGGIRRHEGMLNADYPKFPDRSDFETDEAFQNAFDEARVEPDVADEKRVMNLLRRRETQQVGDEADGPEALIGEPISESMRKTHARFVVELPFDDDIRYWLISYVPKGEKLEWGTKEQSLAAHVKAVRKSLDAILSQLDLPEETRLAAELAIDWHDHGKNRERWQRCAGRKEGQEPLGKSGGIMKRDPRGYRHEFGSLREFADAFKAGKLLDANKNPVSQTVFDLAMHLIATHHGRGRPHFPKGGFDPDCEARSDEIHTESVRRFARLQRKYGWWHLAWLENLLRCADALASAQVNDDEPEAGK